MLAQLLKANGDNSTTTTGTVLLPSTTITTTTTHPAVGETSNNNNNTPSSSASATPPIQPTRSPTTVHVNTSRNNNFTSNNNKNRKSNGRRPIPPIKVRTTAATTALHEEEEEDDNELYKNLPPTSAIHNIEPKLFVVGGCTPPERIYIPSIQPSLMHNGRGGVGSSSNNNGSSSEPNTPDTHNPNFQATTDDGPAGKFLNSVRKLVSRGNTTVVTTHNGKGSPRYKVIRRFNTFNNLTDSARFFTGANEEETAKITSSSGEASANENNGGDISRRHQPSSPVLKRKSSLPTPRKSQGPSDNDFVVPPPRETSPSTDTSSSDDCCDGENDDDEEVPLPTKSKAILGSRTPIKPKTKTAGFLKKFFKKKVDNAAASCMGIVKDNTLTYDPTTATTPTEEPTSALITPRRSNLQMSLVRPIQSSSRSSPCDSMSSEANAESAGTPPSPVLSCSPSHRYITSSPKRSNSIIRIQAMSQFVQQGPSRKISDPERFALKEEDLRSSGESPRTSSISSNSSSNSQRPASRKRRPSSMKIMTPRGTQNILNSDSTLNAFETNLKQEIENNTKSSKDLNTRFYQYCVDGETEKVRFMINRGMFICHIQETGSSKRCFLDVNSRFGKDSETPIHAAARHKDGIIVDLLLGAGAHPGVTDKNGRTPLHHACARGSADAAVVLIAKGAVANIADNCGFSPLQLCIRKHHFTIAKDIMLFGAEINFKGSKGSTVLHDCMAKGDLLVLNFLLELPSQLRVLYNNRDGHNNTPLMLAVANGHLDCVEKLLTSKSDITVAAVNAKGQNIFHLCAQAQRNSRRMFDLLMRLLPKYPPMDSNKIQKLINEKDKSRGYSPLHTAVIHENYEMVHVMCSCTQFTFDLNVADAEGNTPTHAAIIKLMKGKTENNKKILDFLMSLPQLKLSATNKAGQSVKSMHKNMLKHH